MTARKPLRLRPAIVIAIVLVFLRYVVPLVGPDAELFSMPVPIIGIFGGIFCTIALAVWWLFFSRAAWVERVGAIVLAVIALLATYRLVHESIAGGMMGGLLIIYSIPLLGLALVVWAVATRNLADRARRAWLVVALFAACGSFTLLRTAGSFGAGSEFHWRWTPTPEQRLLAEAGDEPKPLPPPAPPPAPVPAVKEPPARDVPDVPVTTKTEVVTPAPVATPAEWPGFRGPERDSVIRGVRINTDWSASPPAEIWRRPIGPGWSSFAVHGDLLYTQEQRGEDEIVACYRLATGKPVWMHRDEVRFWESNGGAGPRATPTLSHGRVYTFGATGIVNALDAATGKVLWTRNAAADTGVKVPDWGFASSPLVVGEAVVIAASGRLVAYDARTGNQRWLGPEGGAGYSSPHLVTLDGVPQIVLLRGSRTISVSPADGTLLWEHVWDPGVGIVQPAQTADGDLLITVSESMGALGIRRIAVAHEGPAWNVEEKWTSRGLKPYFNDFVIHKGHAYGFDGSILSSIDLADGARKWKGGRYGNGQLVLLSDQDALLVISEEGELALVGATPDQYREIARVPVLNAKTWNHPVVIGDILLLRNGEEMAAFRLPAAAADLTRDHSSTTPR
jgi:outer membrane protein assembly factor BamB